MPPTPAQAPSSCGLSCSPVPAVVPALTSSVLSRPSSPNQRQTSTKPCRFLPRSAFCWCGRRGSAQDQTKTTQKTRRKAGGGWHHTTTLTFRVSGAHHRAQDGTEWGFVLHHSVKNEHFVERSRTHSWVMKGWMANNLRRDEIFLSVSLWQRLSQTWLTEGGHQHYPQLNLGSGHCLMQAWLWPRAEALLFVWVCVRKYNQKPSGSIVHLEKGAHNGQHHRDSEDKSQDHHW